MKTSTTDQLGWAVFVIVGILGIAVFWTAASAQALIPDGVVSFIDEFGRACTIYEGSLDCDFDPCNLCEVNYASTPNSTATPIIPRPTSTPYSPTPTSIPEETPEACNRGTGNGAEDFDPGNSAEKPGSAGEDNE